MVAIYGVDELLLRLIHPLLLHYFHLLYFGSPMISQSPIIYFVLSMGILHIHINQTMLNFITESMECSFSHYDITEQGNIYPYSSLYKSLRKGSCMSYPETSTSSDHLTTAIVFLHVAPYEAGMFIVTTYGDKPTSMYNLVSNTQKINHWYSYTFLDTTNIQYPDQAAPGIAMFFPSMLKASNTPPKSIINTHLLKIPPQQNILVNDH